MNVVVAMVLVASGAGYGYVRYQLSRLHRVSIPTLQTSGAGAGTGSSQGATSHPAPPVGAFNVLLVGEDAQGGGQRADTMIVARVDPGTGRAALLSIPYDYFAPIVGGGGPNKISDALAHGPADMVATVEQDLGIRIQHYVQINFQGVASMVNALGGVRLRFPYPSRDSMSGLSVPRAGCVTLHGTQALALVRSRFFSYYEGGYWQYDGSGAFGRIKRQQAFLRATVQRVKASLLGNPLQLNRFVSTAVKDVTVDKGLGVGTLLQLAAAFRGLGSGTLATFTLPTQIVNNDGQYGDVLYPVPSLDNATIARWNASVIAPAVTHPAGSKPGGPAAAGSLAPTTPSSAPKTTTRGGVVLPGPPQAPLGSIVQNRTSASYNPTPC